jgi:hypothetical protein
MCRMISNIFLLIPLKYSTSGFDVTEDHININVETALNVIDKSLLIYYLEAGSLPQNKQYHVICVNSAAVPDQIYRLKLDEPS